MRHSSKPRLYRKGQNPQLDKDYTRCRRMRLWRGDALHEVLSEAEVKVMLNLWHKEKLGFRKLTTEDVSRLVEFAERIRTYRAAAEKEKCRQRMERSRKKLREAAEGGDTVAIRKIKKIKKSARKRANKYYKRKKKKNHVVNE